MSPKDDLVPMLKKLRLSGVLQSLDLRTKQAVEDNLALSEFLYRLLADEVECCRSRWLMESPPGWLMSIGRMNGSAQGRDGARS